MAEGRGQRAEGRWRAAALLAFGLAACARPDSVPKAVATTPFNADSAMSYVRAQLAFGPRVPGTEPARKTGDWIVAHLRATADTVIEQSWTHTTAKGAKLPLRNILARFKPGT
jgi:hypothetical protein